MLRKLILIAIAFTFSLLLTLPLHDSEVDSTKLLHTLPISADVYCLTENIYRETGAESLEGQIAAAQVVLNRMNDDRYPSTACDVIYEHRNGVYQFSWVGQKHKTPIDDKLWKKCFVLAQLMLSGIITHDQMKQQNALFYHSTHVHPKWKFTRIAQIGNHIFYKDIDG